MLNLELEIATISTTNSNNLFGSLHEHKICGTGICSHHTNITGISSHEQSITWHPLNIDNINDTLYDSGNTANRFYLNNGDISIDRAINREVYICTNGNNISISVPIFI